MQSEPWGVVSFNSYPLKYDRDLDLDENVDNHKIFYSFKKNSLFTTNVSLLFKFNDS